MDSSQLLIAIPLLPLLAAVITVVCGPKWLRGLSHVPVVVALALSFICSLLLFSEVRLKQSEQPERTNVGFALKPITLWRWASIDGAYDSTQAAGETEFVGGGNAVRDFTVDITLRADALTAIMLVMVTFISTLVAVYASGYMQGDRGYWRFFSYVGVFVFSMTMLVLVSNFVLLYVFWEAVGVCSYLLIGFWYEKPEAAAAGKKAFLVNRVGDFGFALALFLIWTTYGTLNFHDTIADNGTPIVGVLGDSRVSGVVPFATGGVATAICLLLLLGACGKSAQFPLHVWLPDAMEGPTPVSALIHAATMVTAGVYMVTRCLPLFAASPTALAVVSAIGGFTALLAALIALTQYDLKRVLAYSTISQLGYMFLALGAGTHTGAAAGMFHLFTHAFFKALLFLGAGSVMHAMGGVIDMRKFGGLRRKMPITCGTFLIGCLALAGMPPLAGFFSKDAVLEAVHERNHYYEHLLAPHDEHHAGAAAAPELSAAERSQAEWLECLYGTLYYVALGTALLTAFYTFRAFFLTFCGEERIPAEAGHHAHESPPSMTVPLMVLAACAVGVGWLEFPFADFLWWSPSLSFVTPANAAEIREFPWTIAAVSTLFCFLPGVGLAAYLYLGDDAAVTALARFMRFDWLAQLADGEWLSGVRRQPLIAASETGLRRAGLGFVASGLGYLVQLCIVLLTAPALLARFVSPHRLSQQRFLFDELYSAVVVWPLRAGAEVCYFLDRWLVDGIVNLVGWLPPLAGQLMRALHMGLVQFYALAMMLGLVLLLAVKFWFLA